MKEWQRELRNSVKTLDDLKKKVKISPEEGKKLSKVLETFPMQITPYYMSLINWKDPKDPIKRTVVPNLGEVKEEGFLDPSNEKAVTRCRGLEHKYDQTALMLVSDSCCSYCRFCFRKRLKVDQPSADSASIDIIESEKHLKDALDYIRKHEEIDNVLLSGGDPLMLSNERIDRILRGLRKIEHVRMVRIGTRGPAYLPSRVTSDPEFRKILRRHNREDNRIYFVVHFEHPRELTRKSIDGLNALIDDGIIMNNQSVMLEGVNDNPKVLCELFNKLAYIGVPPYYHFQCRPVISSRHLRVPLKRGYRIFEEAKKGTSGLAKTANFAMSHSSGKVKIVGLEGDRMYFKYHQAKDPRNLGRFFSMKVRDTDLWFDDVLKHNR